jgi:stress response protein YsnF
MAQTVVGVFESAQRARDVQNKVIALGIPEGDVIIHSTGGYQDTTSMAGAGRVEGEGGIAGWFRSLFGSDEDEHDYGQQYSDAVGRGRCVVAAHVQSEQQAEKAVRVMHECGAVDVDERDEGGTASAATATTTSGAAPRGRETTGKKVPIVEEELKVGKRKVDRGVVRVFTRMSEQPVQQDVRLRTERTVVQRTPADRPATGDDMRQASGGTIEVRETTEEPVIEKTARVV